MKIFTMLLFWPALSSAQYTKPLVQVDISHQADTAHVEFKGLRNWSYDLQRSDPKKVVLVVAPIEDSSLARLKEFSDPFISSIVVDKNGVDGKYLLTFNLSQPNLEFFDYLTDEPSRLILDFYRKPEPALKSADGPVGPPPPDSKASASKPEKKKGRVLTGKTAPEKSEYADTPKAGRTPAGDEFLSVKTDAAPPVNTALHFGIFDGSDDNYDRFRIKDYEIHEDAAIASRNNIYLPFPMLKMKVSILDRLREQLPEFVINPKETTENKEARLLMSLFERKRFGHFIKTFDYFSGKHPESEYMEILKNLAAHVYLSRWNSEHKSVDFEKARALFNELVQKYPESPLREYNYLVFGFAQFERGEALTSLQTFEGFIKEYPKSPDMPHVRKARAEAYMMMRKFDEAADELRTVMKDYPRTEHAQEARYRLGDVQFAKGDYTQAIREYEAAIKDLPQQEKVFPNADFNMAEARFWQKDFKKALNNYVQFVNLFPTHDHGGYALTRIGELLGILGADQRRVMGAFLESYFRFPEHPGAKVARIRMLSQQMRVMKELELKKALNEIKDAAVKVGLSGMEEFTTLMSAEGLTNRGQFRDALNQLVGYFQKNPASPNLGPFRQRILRNIANELKADVDAGEFMKALAFYSKYSKTWLKNSDRIDVPYIVGGAYENAGAFDEAERIYRGALTERTRIVGTETEKEKKVQEHLPSVASLNLRLAAVQTQDRNYIDAYQHLKAIGGGDGLSPQENIERVRLSALIAEQKNDLPKAREALLELSKRWQGDPGQLAPVHLQLAQVCMKMGDYKSAEQFADRAVAAEGATEPVTEKTVAAALQVKGDAQMADKRSVAAVESYQKLLERFEDKMPLASVRYKVGQILFDRGDVQGAADVWKRLEGTPNEFLWKIGKEKLEDSQWKGEYRKYINRIPAMTSKSEKEKP